MVRPAPGCRLFRTNPTAVSPESVARLTVSGWSDLPYAAADYTFSAPAGSVNAYRLTMPPPDPDPAANTRIDAGTYGRCDRCGETIAPARLEALPHTRHCVSCPPQSARLIG